MTQRSTNQMRSNPRPRPSFQRFGGCNDAVRVLLVAIHRGPQPAAFLGSHPLQRLQVLLAAPGEEVGIDPMNAMARATAGASRRLLPQLSAASAAGARPRMVQGEILSDDDGRCYEKIGHRIRPLQRLFSGPRGEVLELPLETREEAQAEQRPPSPKASEADASKTEAHAKPRSEAPPRRQQSPQRPFHRPHQRPGEAFGSVSEAAPARGRGDINEPLPPESVTPNAHRQPVPSNSGAPDARRRSVPPDRGAPNVRRQSPPEGGAPNVRRQSPLEGGAPNANARCLRTTIPDQLIKPWEFQIGREEALYDLRAAAATRNAPFAFIRNLKNLFGHRQAWRKWQALLAGKSLDEQLWAVRPPQGLISHVAVRDWARQTLNQAGYDARVMLAEWEIFWRRKGL